MEFYSEKSDKEITIPQILLFELELDEVKEKAKKYFEKYSFEYKDYIIETLEPVYLPYWVYDCNCVAEYDYYAFGKHKTHYSKRAEIECSGILADATSKIEDNLSDQLDEYFDLSKLRDFDISYMDGFRVEECDVTFDSICNRLNKKLVKEVIERELGFPTVATKKINISKNKFTYIQLPFYYAEVNGLKLLVNGQTGDIAINFNEYLKPSLRMSIEKFSNRKKVQDNQLIIAIFGVIFILFTLAACMTTWNKLVSCFPILDDIFCVLILLGIIGGVLYYKFRKKNRRYIKQIIFMNRKKLYFWDEIAREKNTKFNDITNNKITSCIGIAMGICLLCVIICCGIMILMPFLLKVTVQNIWVILLLAGGFLYAIMEVLSLIIHCILRLKGKL